jgi:uncharacterized membrane protein YeiH
VKLPLQYLLEHFGVAVSAISGVLAARGKQVDLFGVIVLALVTAFGGGTIRDVALGDFPVLWVRDTNFLINAAGIAVMTFFVARIRDLPRMALVVPDAFALALFTMIGVQKALGFGVAPAAAIALGVISGVAGGILRDSLTGEIPLVFRREIYLYATAAFCGAVVFVLLRGWAKGQQANMVIAASTTLLLRLAGIRWKIALPVFQRPEKSSELER